MGVEEVIVLIRLCSKLVRDITMEEGLQEVWGVESCSRRNISPSHALPMTYISKKIMSVVALVSFHQADS